MAESDQQRDDPAGLRRRAEELWRKQAADRRNPAQPGADIPLEEALNLLHELEVHQIELEMQNEELRRVQEELATSRARYFDLYDLAPVGYLTLSEEGLILEANLTAANLLGLERSELVKRPLSRLHRPGRPGHLLPVPQTARWQPHDPRYANCAWCEAARFPLRRLRSVPPGVPRHPSLRQGGATGQAAPTQNSSEPLWVRLAGHRDAKRRRCARVAGDAERHYRTASGLRMRSNMRTMTSS